VTVPVGIDGAKTVETAGRVIDTGDAVTVTVVNHDGIAVVHVLAGTVTIFDDGT
jgi:hypothetical protein